MKTATEAFLDIETLPTSDAELLASIEADIVPPKNYKKAETINAWNQNERPALVAEALAETALDGTYGRICAIGCAEADEEPVALVGPEELVISEFFGWVSAMETVKAPDQEGAQFEYGVEVCWVGHNLRNFDLRFLYQRACVLGIAIPRSIRQALDARWNGREMRDTLLMWNPDPSRRVSLDRLCRVLGIDSPKRDFDGSMVARAMADGQIARVVEYVKGDVTATRACYRRLQANVNLRPTL